MPWLKVSDQAANHPIVLSALEMEDADDRVMNELFGFVARCAVSAAAYETDYVLSVGVIKQIAGMSRWAPLTAAAVACGYFQTMQDDEGRVLYRLAEEKDLFHMILKDERAWANQQKRDVGNTKLTVPARKRDGDQCRWCGKIVSWKGDRRSGRAGTYEHLHPGEPATVDTLVIACGACNFARRDDAVNWAGSLRPAPETPYYGAETVEYLRKHGVTVQPSGSLPIEVPGARATASLTPVEPQSLVEPTPAYAGSTEPSDQQSPGPVTAVSSEPDTSSDPEQSPRVERPSEPTPPGRTAPEQPHAEHAQDQDLPSDLPGTKPPWQKSTLPNLDSSGRDGSGRVGKGQAGKPHHGMTGDHPRTEPPAPRTRRGRRRRSR